MGFTLALYPIAYRARFDGSSWREEYIPAAAQDAG